MEVVCWCGLSPTVKHGHVHAGVLCEYLSKANSLAHDLPTTRNGSSFEDGFPTSRKKPRGLQCISAVLWNTVYLVAASSEATVTSVGAVTPSFSSTHENCFLPDNMH